MKIANHTKTIPLRNFLIARIEALAEMEKISTTGTRREKYRHRMDEAQYILEKIREK